MKKQTPLIFLLAFLLFVWFFSLRTIRVKIGDYYYSRGNYDQAIHWYGRIVTKDTIKVKLSNNDRLEYEGDVSKLKAALTCSRNAKLSKIKRLRGFEEPKDVNVKSILPNLLMGLDFSLIVYEENQPYAMAWTKHTVKIEGPVRLINGLSEGLKALMVEGVSGRTRILAPPSVLNLAEGSILAWAALSDPKKQCSTFVSVNDHSKIYIMHQGDDGKFMVYYDGAPVGTRTTSEAVTDQNWHCYVFTWKNGEQKFYIDTREVISGNLQSSNVQTKNLFIGWVGSNDQEQWHGPIDEFLTFDRALTANEVKSLYELRKFFARWVRGSDEHGSKH